MFDPQAVALQPVEPQAVASQPMDPQAADPQTVDPQAVGFQAGGQNAFDSVGPQEAVDLWKDWPDKAPGPPVWSIDYRFRSFWSSSTSKEFGTPWSPPDGWAPLSRLKFPLSSNWHGAEIRVQQPTWDLHFEWLTPQQKGVHGEQIDVDWQLPNNDYTDLTFARERWNEGQMLDLGFDFQMVDRPLDLPAELWPTIGFRWQRFNVTCYDGLQLKENGVWLDPPLEVPGDMIAFNQQYFIGYIGGQVRGKFGLSMLPPIAWKLQGDWGFVGAYNELCEGTRQTTERTYGSMWHIAFTGEMPVTQYLSMGAQFDCTAIGTRGTHRLRDPQQSIDESWDNGVSVWSDQTAVTVFIRLRR
jgi:hypothetical protein